MKVNSMIFCDFFSFLFMQQMSIKREKGGHYIILNGTIYQEDITQEHSNI